MSSSQLPPGSGNQASSSVTLDDKHVHQLVSIMKQLDLTQIDKGSMMKWSVYLATCNSATMITIPLGYHGDLDYAIRVEKCRPGSLNPVENDQKRDPADQLIDLILNFKDDQHTTTVLVLGRLLATRDGMGNRAQSHWIVMLDKCKCLWALYANGIDSFDIKKSSSGRTDVYIAKADNAFGVDKSQGYVAVYIGDIDTMVFDVQNKLSRVNVDLALKSWASKAVGVSNIGDIGVPMFASGFRRLLSVDLTGINIPRYPEKDFYYLYNRLRYRGFRTDLNDINPKRVLTRQETEGAFVQLLLAKYQNWPLSSLRKAYGENALKHKQKMLGELLQQRWGTKGFDNVKRYWEKRANNYPDVDFTEIPDDDDEDHGGLVCMSDSESDVAFEDWREMDAQGDAGNDSDEDMDMDMDMDDGHANDGFDDADMDVAYPSLKPEEESSLVQDLDSMAM